MNKIAIHILHDMIHFIISTRQVDTCEVLLRAGCSRDARTKVDKTPLHVAAQEGHTEICELLLSQGADVDARDMVKCSYKILLNEYDRYCS